MNIKALVLLLGGMSLSFVIVLAIMMSAIGNDRPSASVRRSTDPKKPRTASVQATQKAQAARSTQAASQPTAAPTRAPSPTPPPPSGSEVVAPATSPPPLLPPVPIQEQEAAPAANQLQPDPTTLREFSKLKTELRREIGALTKDRDAMLHALAKTLTALPPQAVAVELAALDDEVVAQTLRHFTAEQRTATLAAMDPKRAQSVRRRLGQLGVR